MLSGHFLDQVLWKGLGSILHVLLELIWPLAKGRAIEIAWAVCAFLRFEILVHQVLQEAGPVELEVASAALRLISFATRVCR